MKKIISAALAAFMAVTALATTAFAADADLKGNSSISLKATTLIPVLKVTLPKTLTFVVNPYAMQIDKSTGKAADAKSIEDNLTTSTVVPVYGTSQIADPEDSTGKTKITVVNTAWQVKNDSGVPLTAALYAKAVNADTTGKLQILEKSGTSAVDIKSTTEAIAADPTKKQLTLILVATPSTGGSEAKKIAIRDKAPETWSADTVATIETIPSAGSLDLTLDATSSAKKGGECNEAWTAKDTATLNVVFNFDFYV